MKYLVTYQRERRYDIGQTVYHAIIETEGPRTWRQLQQQFDPAYHYDNLQFYELGNKVEFKEGE